MIFRRNITMDMFEKWNSNVDLAGLQKDIKDAQDNKREYDEE